MVGKAVPVSAAQHVEDTNGANRALIETIAKGHRWQEMLDTGEVESLTALAEKMDVDRGYVSRVLQLILLAPDIVEAILAGREPSGLA